MQLAAFLEAARAYPGGSFVVAAISGVFHRKIGRPDRDDVFLHEVAGRWPQYAGVVELDPGKGRCDLVVFAESIRVLSGALGGRVDTIASCVRLRGDGLGSLGLSSCKQSMERVTVIRGRAEGSSTGRQLVTSCRLFSSIYCCCVGSSLLASAI